jgi:ubiquinone/menaquinone biosynthesis C-methylase UbiE
MQRFTDQQYLTKDQYKDSFNLDARIAFQQKFSTNPQGWFNWVFNELVKLPADANILELGCGTGEMWKQCADQIPAGWTITLTDLSDGMLDSAWRNLVVTGRGFKFERVDAQSIPNADQTFDAVIANHMLYHIPDRKKALIEIKRVLKDDGSLVATTVGKTHMQEMWNLIERTNGGRQNKVTLSFTLENGKEQLLEFYRHVELTRHPDGLRVTDLEMIIRYIRSMVSVEDLLEEELRFIERELKEVMDRDGEILITKDTGLFIARK